VSGSLISRKVAIVVADGFEKVELTKPRKALERAGAKTYIVSPSRDRVRSWNHGEWGKKFPVDCAIEDADPNAYDALLLPGGVINPDRLRLSEHAIAFVRHFVVSNKPVAAICHGPWMLVEANAVSGRTLTSWPSIKTDIQNAGGNWVDKEVVTDGNITTSRKPDDISAFNSRIVGEFAKYLRSETIVPGSKIA
jgi:protease I